MHVHSLILYVEESRKTVYNNKVYGALCTAYMS